MEQYNHEFAITFRDADVSGHLTMHALIDFMQEASRNHATRLGVNYSALEDEYYWIILRTKVHLDSVPCINQTIRIETFIEGLDKLYSVRRFNIYNEENQYLGYILGYYVLMSKLNHRPVKLKNFSEKAHIFGKDYEGEMLKKLNGRLEDVVRSTTRRVYSSDIDSNNHMNNAHYIRWIVDTFATEELGNQRITQLQIQYVKEVRENQEIEVIRGRSENGEMCVIGTDQGGQVCFVSEFSIN